MFERQREWWEETSGVGMVVAALLAALVVGVLFGVAYISENWQSIEPAAPFVSLQESRAPEEPSGEAEFASFAGLGPKAKIILENHFSSLGGRASISRIRSLWIKGTIAMGREFRRDLLVMKKGGDHLRISLSAPNAPWSWRFCRAMPGRPFSGTGACWTSGISSPISDVSWRTALTL